MKRTTVAPSSKGDVTVQLFSVLFLAMLLSGCDKLTAKFTTQTPEPGWSVVKLSGEEGANRYQLHATSDAKMYRLDTRTGQISLVTDKGITNLPDSRRIQLRVGEIYTLENGKSVLYEGDQKMTTDTRRIADVLVNKYAKDDKSDPLGIRK